jgi:hypothetical protein
VGDLRTVTQRFHLAGRYQLHDPLLGQLHMAS